MIVSVQKMSFLKHDTKDQNDNSANRGTTEASSCHHLLNGKTCPKT